MAQQQVIPIPFSKMKPKTVSFYQSSQDWRSDVPFEMIDVEEARRRKKSGIGYFIPGQNGVMCEVPRFATSPIDADLQPITTSRFEWKILGQTAKPKTRNPRPGPGMPVYQMV